jgi:hypothetical protein
MDDRELGVTWDDIIKMWAKLPKLKQETVIMNAPLWDKTKGAFKPPTGYPSSPLHLCSIPVEILDWPTQIYLVPDNLLNRVKDFADRFGGIAADRLLQHLAEASIEASEEKDDG